MGAGDTRRVAGLKGSRPSTTTLSTLALETARCAPPLPPAVAAPYSSAACAKLSFASIETERRYGPFRFWKPGLQNLTTTSSQVYKTADVESVGGCRYAVDANTGKLRWSFDAGGEIFGGPTLDSSGEVAVVGAGDCVVAVPLGQEA